VEGTYGRDFVKGFTEVYTGRQEKNCGPYARYRDNALVHMHA
jgi:hypothetical protein